MSPRKVTSFVVAVTTLGLAASGAMAQTVVYVDDDAELGGTEININVMDKDRLMEAHRNPMKYPDLIVRVTGFSAYFSSLSEELREIIVNRTIGET